MKADDIEIRAIQRAYDELKCLDPDGVDRALDWLRAKFTDERIAGQEAQRAAQRERIAHMRKPRCAEPQPATQEPK